MTSAQPDSEIATAVAEPGRAAFRRVLLKLSGEALMGDQPYGVDLARVEAIAREVTRVRRDGVVVAVGHLRLTQQESMTAALVTLGPRSVRRRAADRV